MVGLVAVTGANGFIGRHVCAELSKMGWAVRGLIRRAEASKALPEGVEPFVVADVYDPACWVQAVEPAIAVVHLIGRAQVIRETASDPLTAYRDVNVEITKCTLEACIEAGVSHFLFLSSIAAVGRGMTKTYTEEAPCLPENDYGISTREAEVVVLGASKNGHLQATVLRPPLVYGPGSKGNFPRLIHLIERRVSLPLGMVRNACSMVYVKNLTSAIAALLEQPQKANGIFHVADGGEPLSTKELVSRLGTLMNCPTRIVPFPLTLMRFGGSILGRQDDVDRITRSMVISTDRIRKELGWVPPRSVDEGLAETVNWYLSQDGVVK